MKGLFYPLLILLSSACSSNRSEDVDLYLNGKIYTCDSSFRIVQSMAISNGKVIELGNTDDLINAYPKSKRIELKGKIVYPGLFDAHCHFYALGRLESQLNVAGLTSWQKVLDSLGVFVSINPDLEWIVGRGWDQSLFEGNKMPDNRIMDSLFPNKAILLRRVDGHAAVASSKALSIAGINAETVINGGEIEIKNGQLTGLINDNAVDRIKNFIPKETNAQVASYLLKAQELCITAGLTSVTDAGLSPQVIKVIDSLFEVGELKIRINAMISADAEGLAFAKINGAIEKERFRVKSFKIYGDGALGSRGALLKKPYCDRSGHQGMLLTPVDTIKKYCDWASENGFQICTHAIGDSANRLMLDIYGGYTQNKDLRWRIEHAQVVEVEDHELFNRYSIIPSIQPTHATSDMRWASKRLCEERLKGAYAYQALLKQYGKVALGTDFPIEDYKPKKTFYAAVYRQDIKGMPEKGFLLNNGLTKKQALYGMTTWAAHAQFNENRRGQLSPGFDADFVISETDWFTCTKQELLSWKPIQVIIAGEEQLKVNK